MCTFVALCVGGAGVNIYNYRLRFEVHGRYVPRLLRCSKVKYRSISRVDADALYTLLVKLGNNISSDTQTHGLNRPYPSHP